MFLTNVMLKKISCIVLILFSLSVPDVPAWFLSSHGLNSKTCCGRQVCQCKHAKGAFCPLRAAHDHQKPAIPPSAGSIKMGTNCHLHTAAEQPLPAVTNTVQSARDGWTKAPCQNDQTKTTGSGYEKTFNSGHGRIFEKEMITSNFFSILPVLPVFLTDKRLERPPHFLLLF